MRSLHFAKACGRDGTIVMFLGFSMVVIAALFTSGNISLAATVTNFVQGTGPTFNTPANDLSADNGWKADFAPVQGTNTMDQSVADGVNRLSPIIKGQLNQGQHVKTEAYSLGTLVAGDTTESLAKQGVDLSNADVLLSSDGRTRYTGALTVIDSLGLGPIAKMLGITATGPRTTYGNAHVVSDCWGFDGVCDMKDPTKDPVGAVYSILGYFTQHAGKDPLQNYTPESRAAAKKSTFVDELGVEHITYTGKNPGVRGVEMLTNAPIDPTLERVMNAFVMTKTGPGEKPVYKTLPEAIAEAAGVKLPGFTQAPAVVPAPSVAPASTTEQQSIVPAFDQGADMLNTVAPGLGDQVQGWVDNGTQMLESLANGGLTNEAPASYTEPAYITPAAPAAPAFQAPIQQIASTVQSAVANAAPQATPVVNNLINQGMALLGGV